MTEPIHVVPVNDLIEHDADHGGDDCPCGPESIPVLRDDGSIAWVISHHSLDGRERYEALSRWRRWARALRRR